MSETKETIPEFKPPRSFVGKCLTCDQQFLNLNAMKLHSETKHAKPIEPPNAPKNPTDDNEPCKPSEEKDILPKYKTQLVMKRCSNLQCSRCFKNKPASPKSTDEKEQTAISSDNDSSKQSLKSADKLVTYTCRTCQREYKRYSAYLTHIKSKHAPPLKCLICNESFDSKLDFFSHYKATHVQVGPTKPPDNSELVKDYKTYKPAQRTCEADAENTIGNSTKLLKEALPSIDLTSGDIISRHSDKEPKTAGRKPTTFQCTHCGWSCFDRKSLIVHGSVCYHSHMEKGTADVSNRKSVCPDCSFCFKSKHALRQHKQSFCACKSKEKRPKLRLGNNAFEWEEVKMKSKTSANNSCSASKTVGATIREELKEVEKEIFHVKDVFKNCRTYKPKLRKITEVSKVSIEPTQTEHEQAIDCEDQSNQLTESEENKQQRKKRKACEKSFHTCTFCWSVFECLQTFMGHKNYCLYRLHQPSSRAANTDQTTHPICRKCNYSFRNERQLARHQQSYCPGKPKAKLAGTKEVGEISTDEGKDENLGNNRMKAMKGDTAVVEPVVKNEPIVDDGGDSFCTALGSIISIKKEPEEEIMDMEELDLKCEIKTEEYAISLDHVNS